MGVGWASNSFLIIPEFPYPLLVRDLLTKMKAKIYFSNGGVKSFNEDGKPIQVLVTSSLTKEYRFYQVATGPDPNWRDGFQSSNKPGPKQEEWG